LIGAGGMGEVYRARDTRLGRDVAIKILPESFARDADRLRRFELEARATSLLNHPNLLTIHDFGIEDGAPYIVAELLDGRSGRLHLAARLPMRIELMDVSPNGDLLLEDVEERSETYAVAAGGRQSDLTWVRFSEAEDLSADGATALIEYYSPEHTAFLRPVDGRPPLRLSEGQGCAISPDGKNVLVIDKTTRHIAIVPSGAGESLILPDAGFSTYHWANWMPDGHRVIFSAGQKDAAPPRTYLQSITAHTATPITPAGAEIPLGCKCVSPDGEWVAAQTDRETVLFSTSGKPQRAVPNVQPREIVRQFSSDGRSLFVAGEWLPATVVKIDLETGARTIWKKNIMPVDTAGAETLDAIRIAPDGSYVYTVWRGLTRLFLAKGLFQ
jgi:Protein kinase domain